MTKKFLSFLVGGILLLAPAVRAAAVTPQKQDTTQSTDQIKVQVAKLGVGEKARGTVTLRDGSQVKGYIYRADDNEFVVRDRKTDAPTTIRYTDVARVKADRGHSKAKHLGLGIGIGVGAFLGVLLIAFAHLND